MSAHQTVYRNLVRLYPHDFRRGYADDLVQYFTDLVDDRGARKAWTRTGVDLIVTVPRYRLECIMNEQHSASALNAVLTVLAAAGILSVLSGLYPGALLLIAAVALAVAQRTALGRAIRTPDSNRRRRRLGAAAILAAIFIAAVLSYMRAIGMEHISGTSLVLHNAIGIPAMVGAIIFLIAGLCTPRTPDRGSTGPIA